MTSILLKKNKYIDNGIVEQKLIDTINFVSKNNYTLEYASSIINNPPIILKKIFKKIDVDYLNIKYIIMGIPKTGNHSLYAAFKSQLKDKEEILFFHSIIELLYQDLNFINYNIYDILKFISKYSKHTVYVISSYRDPLKRIVSKFYHDNIHNDHKLSDIPNITTSIINDLDYNIYYNHILKNELGINNSSCYYNIDHGIGTYKYKKNIVFVFTCLEHFNKFEQNINKYIPNLNNFSISHENKNILPEYEKEKEKETKINDEIINELYQKEKNILDYYQL
jgi:hypothetical protein